MSFSIGPGLFRLILALMVVLSHMSSLNIGRPAVFAFFALSGYWVLRMYDEKYRGAAPLSAFYQSRFLRIWPPFAVAFLATFVISALWGTAFDSAYFSGLMLLGIASSGLDVLGTSWSLDIELQFYLAIPLFWLLLRSNLIRGAAGIGLFFGGTAVLTWAGWWLILQHNIWTFLAYLPTFLTGAVIWRIQPHVSKSGALLSLALFLGLGLLAFAIPGARGLVIKGTAANLMLDWAGMAWVATLVPFIAWNVQQNSSALDLHLGNYSYALYITHWPAIALLTPLLKPMSSLEKLGLLGFCLILGVVFYLTVDRPLERLRQSALRRQRLRKSIDPS